MTALSQDIEEMTALAQTLVRTADIKVICGDFWPSADLKNRVIRLPDLRALPPAERPRFAHMLRGWFYHEVGHVWFTVPDYSQALHGQTSDAQTSCGTVAHALRCHERWGNLFTHLAVTVEDIRVDQLLVASRPGLARCMQELAQEENDPLQETLAGLAVAAPLTRLTGAILLVGRQVTTMEHLPDAITRLINDMRPAFEAAVRPRTPDDVVETVEALLMALESLAEEAASRTTLPEHAPETDALDLYTAPDHGHHGCATAGDTIGMLIDEAVAAAVAVGWTWPDPLDDDSLEDDLSDEDSPRPYKVLSTDWDECVQFSRPQRQVWSTAFQQDCRAARAAAGALIDVLVDTLTRETSDEVLLGQDYGATLDPSAYHRLHAVASPRDIWMDCRPSGALEAAVMLLVDCSGSMCTADEDTGMRRDALARVCTTALHLALKPSGIPHAVYGFTTAVEDPSQLVEHAAMRRALGENMSVYARTTTAARYYLFKTFDSDDARAVAGIQGEGANLDGEAVALASAALRARPEALKLLLVLSDGWPSGTRHGPTGEAYLRQAVREAERSGIRVVGIGIADDAVCVYYPEHIVVHRLRELPGQMLAILRQVLLEG